MIELFEYVLIALFPSPRGDLHSIPFLRIQNKKEIRFPSPRGDLHSILEFDSSKNLLDVSVSFRRSTFNSLYRRRGKEKSGCWFPSPFGVLHSIQDIQFDASGNAMFPSPFGVLHSILSISRTIRHQMTPFPSPFGDLHSIP